jgi:hypothetical protein
LGLFFHIVGNGRKFFILQNDIGGSGKILSFRLGTVFPEKKIYVNQLQAYLNILITISQPPILVIIYLHTYGAIIEEFGQDAALADTSLHLFQGFHSFTGQKKSPLPKIPCSYSLDIIA